MATRETLHAMVDQVQDAQLEELQRLMEGFASRKGRNSKPGIMSRLERIKIEAPEDFSENFGLYMAGESSGG